MYHRSSILMVFFVPALSLVGVGHMWGPDVAATLVVMAAVAGALVVLDVMAVA